MSHATQEKNIFTGNTHDRLSHDTPRQTRQAGRQGRFYYCDRCLTAVWILTFLGLCFAENARTGLDKAGASGPTSISLWPGVGWVWSCKSLRLEEKKILFRRVGLHRHICILSWMPTCLKYFNDFHWVLAQWFTLALQEASKYMPRRELRVVDTEFVMGTSFDSGKKLQSLIILISPQSPTSTFWVDLQIKNFPFITQLREFGMKVISIEKQAGSRLPGQHGLSW